MDREPKFLRVKQVARLLNCGARTVQNLCNSGQLVSIRLPNGRGDRRISMESVKVLLKQDGVEIDLRDLGTEERTDKSASSDTRWPCVVSIGVPFGVLNSLSMGNGHFYRAESMLMGCALIGSHKPDVVILDATAITNHESVKVLEETIHTLVHECILILRCYDDPSVYDPRPQFVYGLANDPLLKSCDESSTHLNQIVLAALKSKGKVPA